MTRAFAQDAAESAAAASTGPGDRVMEAEPALTLQKLDVWIEGFYRQLPNIAVALAVLAVFVVLAWAADRAFRRSAARRGRENLGEVLGGFIRWVVIVAGVLIAMTIVFPSVRPGDLLAGLGVGSVAIGFAFKDILQNWLAGLLLLIRQPFKVGDQIVVNDYEGTVDHIETQATLIRTYDGRRVLIPNSQVYMNAVTVNTAFSTRRSQYDVGIGYGDSIPKARDVILKALAGVKGIVPEPPVEVLAWELAASWVTLRIRWWTGSRRTDVVHIQSAAIEAVKKALDDSGIDLPYETVVQLWHDQTEEWDGVRGRQREGWPRPNGNAEPPRPARIAMARQDRESRTNGGSPAAAEKNG